MLTAAAILLQAGPPSAPGTTWATAGPEHELFACADVNADGFEDLVVEVPGGGLLVAESVRGWKAAPWKALDDAAWPGGRAAFEEKARERWTPFAIPSAPPYELGLVPLRVIRGDLDGDRRDDALAIYRCARPGDFLELRVALAPDPDSGDRDDDGLSDAEEVQLGTDPLDRDSDGDGLLDGWEVHGLPRGIAIGEGERLDPRRQDVIVAIAAYEPLELASLPLELAKAAALYAKLPTKNPDGSHGIALHFRYDARVPIAEQKGGDWGAVGGARFPLGERGFLHWMQITPWGGGQAQQTGDMGGCGTGYAVFAHEFGHQLSLSHEGDSPAAWCPLYPSLMSYAFSYSLGGDGDAIRFSDGRFRASALDESKLDEHLPYPYADLKYLEAGPFRFTLADDGAGGTRIDWNQNGRFDDAPVCADVNYGGSTYCGTRRMSDRMGDRIGAAPSLCYVGERAYLVALEQHQGEIFVREYQGEEKWGDKRPIPSSATSQDPVVVGTKVKGYVLFRTLTGWSLARFDHDTVDPPQAVGFLTCSELSAGVVDGEPFVVEVCNDGKLFGHALRVGESSITGSTVELELRSQVPVGIAQDPADGRIVIASAMTNSKGTPFCLRVSWFHRAGEQLVLDETRWVRGEASGTNCTTRPVVVFDPEGQLDVFHTGMPDGNGQMTAWRTRRIGNAALDEGWLTCMLYDVWTRTRVGVAFASGPQGALFAFRWDSGDYGEWKINTLLLAHNGFGIDPAPMRDFDDAAKISKHGLVHSILWMQPEPPSAPAPARAAAGGK